MGALTKKLLRDLWRMRGQALAIALVIAGGVATFVMSFSMYESLDLTRASYYRDYRLADVFSTLKRAPEGVKARVEEVPGVDIVETRVVAPVKIEIEGFSDPVTGTIVSIPYGQPALNRLYLRGGRLVGPGRTDEVVLSEPFAEAHGLGPGDRIHIIIKGQEMDLDVVGVALAPEYIYQLAPGALFPDFKRYGVLWMGREPLEAAYDMEGAFNDVSMSLAPDAAAGDVIDRLDVILAPYGGLGAYGRKDQLSNRYLSEELHMLGQMAFVFPVIFLGVAVFLLNVVITRLVNIQREQIAVLKAFGYGNLAVGLHYLWLVLLLAAVGVAAGVAAGAWLGKNLSEIYMIYYRFPFLDYTLSPRVVVYAGAASAASAAAGTFMAVRRAAGLPPAEAMRPEPPAVYRESALERLGLGRLLSQPGRMILRHIARRPVKSALSTLGIGFAVAVMMAGTFFGDAVDFMVDVQFNLSGREDLTVTFSEPASARARLELTSIPGVWYGEPFRTVPARLRFEHRSYRTSVQGVEPGADLHRLLDADLRPIEVPRAGIVLTDYLGGLLGVEPGDRLTVEVLEGSRPTKEVPVAALVSQYVGVGGFMERRALNRLMDEGAAISGVHLAVDPLAREDIYRELKEIPGVAGTVARRDAVSNFFESMGDQVFIYTFFTTILAAVIAFGVVYNSARIALAERSRELASLRVLGFTRGEISYILLGELALLTLAAMPVGFVVGRLLSVYIISQMQNDLFRIPLVLEADTYAFSALVVLVSAAASGLIVRTKLDRLDLVSVLKTKE
ncbi:MAG: FtsX-like permease family protein [Thermodesulfobacteriota bacterium]